MDVFLKAAACALITVILGLALAKRDKDITLLLSIAACCMILAAAMAYLEPILSFFQELRALGQLDADMLGILLRAVGIGLIGELAVLICGDAGNAALGKALQILSAAMVLWLSIPLLRSLLELIQEILGEV